MWTSEWYRGSHVVDVVGAFGALGSRVKPGQAQAGNAFTILHYVAERCHALGERTGQNG